MEESKKRKFDWKKKILATILIGLVYVALLSLMDYLTEEQLQNWKSYVFQGLFFGTIVGMGLPYLTLKYPK